MFETETAFWHAYKESKPKSRQRGNAVGAPG